MTPEQLGIPPGTRVMHALRDREGGWQQEYIALPVDTKPAGAVWPWLRTRQNGEAIAILQVWYLAMTHEPSGFRLARRWHPSMGDEREWTATSRDGEFGLLGQARGLFRHAGRRPAVKGPEEIRDAHVRLTRAIGRTPTTARLARELGMTTPTLRGYMARWHVELGTEKV